VKEFADTDYGTDPESENRKSFQLEIERVNNSKESQISGGSVPQRKWCRFQETTYLMIMLSDFFFLFLSKDETCGF